MCFAEAVRREVRPALLEIPVTFPHRQVGQDVGIAGLARLAGLDCGPARAERKQSDHCVCW